MEGIQIVNEKVWDIILKFPKGPYRILEQSLGISIGTLSGWKNGKHVPREDSRLQFLYNLSMHLSESEKEDLFRRIMKILGIEKNTTEWCELEQETKHDFYIFLNQALNNELLRGKFHNEENGANLLWEILVHKFKEWFSSETYISFETKKIGGRITFLISVNEPGKEIPPIIFSYLDNCRDLEKEEESLRQFNSENKREYLLHISVTLAAVNNKNYLRFLRFYNVYLKEIQGEDFEINAISSAYFYFKDSAYPAIEYEMNRRAEIVFRKFLDSSYLIYKEILCSKYDATDVNSNFFQSNLGIGNYPYAMRRAISFEKKQIENKIKEIQKLSNNKFDLLIDLNCLGGLYGLRLSKYAKQVLCVDASNKTLQAIKHTIVRYNKKDKDNMIANVQTELFREDSCDILTNQNLAEKADCIIIGLGTMSYIKSPELLLRKIGTWLKKDGVIFLSCYNQESLSVKLKRYENLYYEYDPYHKRFVYAREKINIPVPIRMYTFSAFKNTIISHFDFETQTTWSYPILSSIFSINEYDKAFEVIKEVDKVSAMHSQYKLASGNYNMIMARNHQNVITSDLYMKTKSAMMNDGIMYQAIQHQGFVSRKTLFEVLREKGITNFHNFIKSIIINDFSNPQEILYYMIILPLGNRFKWDYLKLYYTKKSREFRNTKVRFCTERELRNMGFAIGCICPFAYSVLKEKYHLELIYDYSINDLPYDMVYTYSGRNDITLELKREELLNYLKEVGVSFNRME